MVKIKGGPAASLLEYLNRGFLIQHNFETKGNEPHHPIWTEARNTPV